MPSLCTLPLRERGRKNRSDNPGGDIVEAGIDDVMFLVDDGNEPPAAPLLVSPADGAGDLPTQPTLEVANTVDPEGDALTYGFRVYSDALLTAVVASTDGAAEGPGTTSWTVTTPLQGGATYWWRAYAEDTQERGLSWGRTSSPWESRRRWIPG